MQDLPTTRFKVKWAMLLLFLVFSLSVGAAKPGSTKKKLDPRAPTISDPQKAGLDDAEDMSVSCRNTPAPIATVPCPAKNLRPLARLTGLRVLGSLGSSPVDSSDITFHHRKEHRNEVQ